MTGIAKKIIILSIAYSLLPIIFQPAYAKEITIIYSATTHAMLYPCSCPIEPDGGIARRAALVKELRRKYPNSLLLDSGNFFAGGLLDEYTLNTQLDMQRTEVNLKAMELMKYDAVGIGIDEFNFGREFFNEKISKTKLNFLSCNIQAQNVLPYIIKEVSGVKVGIIAVTSQFAKQKAIGLNIAEPKPAVASRVAELKSKGAGIIILLSSLNENENLNLISGVSGIDILIEGYNRTKEEPFLKIGNTLILRPSWQGRRLATAVLTLKGNKIAGQKIEELRLSDKIPDDSSILSILPRCFSDVNCAKAGVSGLCEGAGTLNSRCLFNEANKIPLFVISARDCATCNTQATVNSLKKQFPGVSISYLYYPQKQAENMVKDFAISGLPAYLFGKEIEKEKNFEILKPNLYLKGDFYLLNPQSSGISFFVNRKKVKGSLDLFISLYDKNTRKILEAIKEFNPRVHFLAVQAQERFDAISGNLETEEYLRAVCVQKYYPKEFWNYISCRSQNINSSWWEDCLVDFDSARIKSCARSAEAAGLLKENIGLNKELQIMFGPTYLLDNQEVFGSRGVPSKEELKKIIKR